MAPGLTMGKTQASASLISRNRKLSMSMALAGGSSILIAGDALRLWGETVDDTDPGVAGTSKGNQSLQRGHERQSPQACDDVRGTDQAGGSVHGRLA